MKTEALQELGLTEDQIKEVFKLNGKDVDAEKKKTEAAEADRDQWKTRAEDAEKTLTDFDGVDVEGLQKQIKDLEQKAADAEKEYKDRIYERDFDDAIKVAFDGIKFTSDAAKRAVMSEVKAGGKVTFKDGKLYGFEQVIAETREKDASAFAADENGKPPAKFTDPKRGAAGGNHKSLKDFTLDERIKLKKDDPQYYEQLKKGN